MRILAFTFCCLTIITALFSGCKPMPNDGIPFYLQVDSLAVVLDNNNMPTYSHGITDVWVEAGASNLGAYELPANFPVLKEGNVPFVLSAGVWLSGQQNYRQIYPFYDIDTFTLTAERGQTYSHAAKFKYKPGVTFKINGDFEANSEFDGIAPTSSNVQYGTACGILSVDSINPVKLGFTIDSFDLPEGREVWVEFDYKAVVPFNVGYFGLLETGGTVKFPSLYLNPRDVWRKVYLKITESIVNTRAEWYKIYFEAVAPVGTNGGNVYIDNVRIVYY